MDMLKPAIEPRRFRGPSLLVSLAFVAGALVGVAGSLVGFLVAPYRVTIVEERRAAAPGALALTAQIAARNLSVDLLSADAYRADGTVDEVFDVELRSTLAVRHIFLNGNGGAHQWDTVIGGEVVPFGRVFGGHRGDATWHLGVRKNGAWITNAQTGELRELAAGTHRLELIATGVSDGPGPRTVTVMFVDGTTMTAVVPITSSSRI